MVDDPHNISSIPLGTPVRGFNGTIIGVVRDVHAHFLLVGNEGEHASLEVPVHSIIGFENGVLQVHVNRESATEVDDVETSHHLGQD